jgi:hypothetical protein
VGREAEQVRAVRVGGLKPTAVRVGLESNQTCAAAWPGSRFVHVRVGGLVWPTVSPRLFTLVPPECTYGWVDAMWVDAGRMRSIMPKQLEGSGSSAPQSHLPAMVPEGKKGVWPTLMRIILNLMRINPQRPMLYPPNPPSTPTSLSHLPLRAPYTPHPAARA